MSKVLGGMLGAGLLSGLIFTTQTLAAEVESAVDRDLTVKEAVDHSSDKDRTEIGEVERETDHDSISLRNGNEIHDSLHEDHESANGEAHEAGMAETHDSGAGARELTDHQESR